MQDIKPEDPEFWCQMYTRRTEEQTSKKKTKLRVRSKSYSPTRSLGNYSHNLNLTGQLERPSYGSTCLVSLSSPLATNSKDDKKKDSIEIDQHKRQDEGKGNAARSKIHYDVTEVTKNNGEVSPVKRKKTRGKARAHDRATMQFIRKAKADSMPCCEQNSTGQFSSYSNLDADNVNRKVDKSNLKKVNTCTSNLDLEKETPGVACNIQQEAGEMQDNQPCLSSSSGVHGLCPGITHNAYVLHWLQQHSGQPQNQNVDRKNPHLHNSPCHLSFQAPSNSCYPFHSSPVHQSQYAYSDCPCTPGMQDMTNELMTMIQQETSQPSCLLQPPGDFHSIPCQNQHQIPISPGAKSFLAMLQHKPEMSTIPCSHCPTHLSSIEQTCHALGNVCHPSSSMNVQCVSHGGQACNSPQHSACSPIVSPPRLQHKSPCSRYHTPNINMCSLEHAAMLLHRSQLHDSPVRLNTSSLGASHGSPARTTMMQNSPANSSQQILEDSVAMSSFYDGNADRSKCDDKSTSENPAPIGVFWDIENCAVPRGKSALAVVQSVRDRFFSNHREAEFMCVCDINKENATVIQELNDAQVTVAHINATAKNAADDKLKQSLRRFADTHSPPATVVLISGDVNFARDLSDLRHRNNLRVILVHRDEASEALKACANEVVRYQDLVHDLPYRSPTKQSGVESCTLIIHNLPCRKDASQLRNRLKQLSENCGGKVIHVSYKNAVIQFPNMEKASRAKIRLDGENVFGNKISVAYPKNKNTNSPVRHSNKVSPQLIQDNNEDMMVSQSDSKEEEEDERYDSEEEVIEEQDQEEERSSRSDSEYRACTDSKNRYRSGYPASPNQPHYCSADSQKAKAVKELPAMNTSANRIAAAFRPIQHNMKYSTEFCNSPFDTTHSKPVIEIWPQRDCTDAEAKALPIKTDLIPVSASMVSLMNFPSSVSLGEHSNHPSNTGQLDCNIKAVPGLLPFKPAPTVQRIPTPPQFQQGHAMWNRASCEQRSNSPTLRGMYRPPSPMLANPMGDWQYMSVQDPDNGVRKGAELLVTNLDNKMSRQDLKKSLLAKLNEHCKVLHLIFGSPVPGRYQAVVRVPSIPDAIRAMANINRCQIGTRLLHVSLLMPTDSNADKLRLMIIPMLQEIPGMCQPLCDLKTSFERRYRQILYVGDLYHIPDTLTIRETSVGKVVALTTQSRPSTPNSDIHSPGGIQSPASFFIFKEPLPEPCEPFCSIHDCQDTLQYRHVTQDPFVIVSIRTFSSQVHTLLLMHNGKIPLISFMVCYAAEFSTLTEDFENGVPLEHLLTCIQGVRVGVSRDGFKTVCWEQSKPQPETGSRSSTPLLPPQLFQFSKEAVELLKHTPRCRLAFSKFIPSYHHHFGRQCRVADYGFLKLIELFDAISHVMQVLGMTENKLLTLTHRTQIKRFSQDLLKVLKSQASRQVKCFLIYQFLKIF
ncbi:meiosis regulator and mRNA stability factor 1-like [Patiria miniata]|uniref:Meiosis regulator and mRNA stability factor 1 n=1 Tax=Patiria miniata TaxID=46514 RepID=A0A914AL77_PATMI|nr:meiosis regulator and mRNA stability factor 1-like [Patiria miniata]